MCYRPVHIWHNSNHFTSESMPLQLDVPCGKCEDCLRSRQSEWFVRSYYHWQQIKEFGGDAFFYTLTWNDDNLPYTIIDGIKITHFSLSHVQSFTKRLKERIRSKYGSRLDYLITCEFGYLYNRPHLHAIFYLNHGIMPHVLYNEINESWQKGFVYAGKNGGRLDNYTGILYVTKYITKDIAFQPLFTKIYDYTKQLFSENYRHFMSDNPLIDCPSTFDELLKNKNSWTDNEEVIKWVHDFNRIIREKCPYVSHSTKLGYGLLSHPNMIQLQDETCLVPQGHQFISVPLPRFIKRALWYDRVPNERDGKLTDFVLNDEGKKHLISTLDRRIEKRTQDFENFFKGISLTDQQFERISDKMPFKFEGNKSFNLWLRHIDADFRKLAIYSYVYRNRVQLQYEIDNQPYQINYFKDYSDFYLYALLYPKLTTKFNLHELDVKQLNYIYGKLYNHLPTFALYEQLIITFNLMRQVIREDYANLCRERELIQRKTRDVIKMSKIKIA